MYELTTQELMVFVVLGFSAGVFATYYLARLFEIVHTWRLVRQTVVHLLLMCTKIVEDVAFLGQMKEKYLTDAEFTPKEIQRFKIVEKRTLTNWQESVIMSLVSKAPPHFKTLLPFKNWKEAMEFMERSLERE